MGITVINGKAETVDRAAASYSQTIFVDQSGRGNFKNIQAAIDSVPSNNQNWVRIYVEPGVYR